QLGVGNKRRADVDAGKTQIDDKREVLPAGDGQHGVAQHQQHGQCGNQNGQAGGLQHGPVGDPFDHHAQTTDDDHADQHGHGYATPAGAYDTANQRQHPEADESADHVQPAVGKIE